MEDQHSIDDSQQSLEFSKKWRQNDAAKDYRDDEHHSVIANISVQDNLKNNSLSYQTQKIMINDAEEEDGPCYKSFFEKDKKQSQMYQDDETEKRQSRSPQRWEILYEKAKESRIAKNELIKEFETPKEDPECTFRPKLITSYNNRLMSSPGSVDQDGILPFHERSKAWKQRVDGKITETRGSHKDKDLNACTFRPDLVKSQTRDVPTKALTSYGAKGIDQFLRRQILAKHSKGEKDSIRDNPLLKLPSHVYKKTGNITIPKAPEFNSGKSIEINSLKKPFEFPTPSKASKRLDTENESPQKSGWSQKESQTLVDPIHVHSVKFGDAIQRLHSELQAFNIDSN